MKCKNEHRLLLRQLIQFRLSALRWITIIDRKFESKTSSRLSIRAQHTWLMQMGVKGTWHCVLHCVTRGVMFDDHFSNILAHLFLLTHCRQHHRCSVVVYANEWVSVKKIDSGKINISNHILFSRHIFFCIFVSAEMKLNLFCKYARKSFAYCIASWNIYYNDDYHYSRQ